MYSRVCYNMYKYVTFKFKSLISDKIYKVLNS